MLTKLNYVQERQIGKGRVICMLEKVALGKDNNKRDIMITV